MYVFFFLFPVFLFHQKVSCSIVFSCFSFAFGFSWSWREQSFWVVLLSRHRFFCLVLLPLFPSLMYFQALFVIINTFEYRCTHSKIWKESATQKEEERKAPPPKRRRRHLWLVLPSLPHSLCVMLVSSLFLSGAAFFSPQVVLPSSFCESFALRTSVIVSLRALCQSVLWDTDCCGLTDQWFIFVVGTWDCWVVGFWSRHMAIYARKPLLKRRLGLPNFVKAELLRAETIGDVHQTPTQSGTSWGRKTLIACSEMWCSRVAEEEGEADTLHWRWRTAGGDARSGRKRVKRGRQSVTAVVGNDPTTVQRGQRMTSMETLPAQVEGVGI